ncbi:MAG TPA: hypothetical protein VE866_13370 [Candidatus Binatia bacterium]|nr:hypothetical protein [Candidatus Binatia bacterium]
MSNFVTWVLALATCVGTTAALAIHHSGSQDGHSSESRLAVDGAYRDGLYVGKLAARSGRRSRPPIGRWSAEKDRASFLAGYERTYNVRSSQSPYAKSTF